MMTQENTETVGTADTTETVETVADAQMEEATEEAVIEETVEETVKEETPKWDSTDHERACKEVYQEILEHFRSFSPADQVASQITEEHITQYLEGGNEERIQQCRERREKRLFHFLEIIAVLVSIVLIVKFLSDNPALLTNILYILGGIAGLYIWKHPHIKDDAAKKDL